MGLRVMWMLFLFAVLAAAFWLASTYDSKRERVWATSGHVSLVLAGLCFGYVLGLGVRYLRGTARGGGMRLFLLGLSLLLSYVAGAFLFSGSAVRPAFLGGGTPGLSPTPGPVSGTPSPGPVSGPSPVTGAPGPSPSPAPGTPTPSPSPGPVDSGPVDSGSGACEEFSDSAMMKTAMFKQYKEQACSSDPDLDLAEEALDYLTKNFHPTAEGSRCVGSGCEETCRRSMQLWRLIECD